MSFKRNKFLLLVLTLSLFFGGSSYANENKNERPDPANTPVTSAKQGGEKSQGGGSASNSANTANDAKVQQPVPAPSTTSQPVEVQSSPTTTVTQPSGSTAESAPKEAPASNAGGNSNPGGSSKPENSSTSGAASSSEKNDTPPPAVEQPTARPTPSADTSSGNKNDTGTKNTNSVEPKPSPQPSPNPQSTSTSTNSTESKGTSEIAKQNDSKPAEPTPTPSTISSSSTNNSTKDSTNNAGGKPRDIGAVSLANSNTGVSASNSKKVIVSAATLKNPNLIAGKIADSSVNGAAKELEQKSPDQTCGANSTSQTVAKSLTKSTASSKATSTKSKGKSASGSPSSSSSSTSSNEEAEAPTEECKDFIVVFTKDSTKSDIDAAAQNAKGKVLRNFNTVFKGALLNGPPSKVLALAKNPKVEVIEQDGVVRTQALYSNAVWGLDRVDQRLLPLDSNFDDLNNSGSSIPIYIVDSGLYAEHSEFSGRVAPGVTTISDGYGTWDCNGHGTHVSGIAAGTNFGIAKSANLIPVRVLGCNGSGTYSGVIAGLDWIAANHPAGVPGVVNMSLSGPASSTLDSAVNNLISRGLTVVVAAGNAAADACSYSPARVAGAITVAATAIDDTRANYSNYGSCIDVFAPGSSITSAWINGITGSAVASGTSMSSPHVAGAIARFLFLNPLATPLQVTEALIQSTTKDLIVDAGLGSLNRLLFIDFAPAPTPEPSPTTTTKPTRKKTTNPGKGNKP